MTLEKQYSCRPSVSAVIDTEPVSCRMCFPRVLLWGSESWWFQLANDYRSQMDRYQPKSQYLSAPLLLLGMIQSSRTWPTWAHKLRLECICTLSWTCRSSKKHSFFPADTSIKWADTNNGRSISTERTADRVYKSLNMGIVIEKRIATEDPEDVLTVTMIFGFFGSALLVNLLSCSTFCLSPCLKLLKPLLPEYVSFSSFYFSIFTYRLSLLSSLAYLPSTWQEQSESIGILEKVQVRTYEEEEDVRFKRCA